MFTTDLTFSIIKKFIIVTLMFRLSANQNVVTLFLTLFDLFFSRIVKTKVSKNNNDMYKNSVYIYNSV